VLLAASSSSPPALAKSTPTVRAGPRRGCHAALRDALCRCLWSADEPQPPHRPERIGSWSARPWRHGSVNRAEHLETGQAVALKTVRVPREWLLQSIRREIHALARIRHPGIVRSSTKGWTRAAVVRDELLEGKTLLQHCAELAARSQPEDEEPWTETARSSLPDSHLPERGAAGACGAPMSLQQGRASPPAAAARRRCGALLRLPAAGGALLPVLGVVRRLCAPLAFLHGEGIVHRDLKPSNVWSARMDAGAGGLWAGGSLRERAEPRGSADRAGSRGDCGLHCAGAAAGTARGRATTSMRWAASCTSF
jgi:hypothetical protein